MVRGSRKRRGTGRANTKTEPRPSRSSPAPLLSRIAPPSELQARSVLTALRRHPMKRFRSASEELPSAPVLHLTDKTYIATANDVIMDRYLVLSSLGRGSFGTVVRTVDRVTGTGVAIKVLHKDEDLNVDPEREVQVYRKLLSGCRPQIELFAAVLDYGEHMGFACIAFELCQSTLCDVTRGFSGLVPLPGRQLVEIAYQIVSATEYLHSLGIIHCDLKPDNIALCSAETVTVRWLDAITGFHDKRILKSTQIRVLDLGTAIGHDEKPLELPGRVGNRGYRAPEISFGTPWSFGVDAFAVGCVLAELYLGGDLFPADMDTDREHLAMVDKLVGPFSEEYAHGIEDKLPGTFSFVGRPAIRFPRAGVSLSAEEHGEPMKRLEKLKPLSASNPATIHDALLYDLTRKLMTPDPAERLKMSAAAKHAYFDVLAKLQWQ